jgi:ABC-type transport system substrate-binding protein
VAQTLARQLHPDSENYDERLSGYLRSIQVHSPYRLELEFTRAPLRPEAILSRAVPSSQPWFSEINRTGQSCSWVRSVPEPEDAPVFHVAEVREIGLGSHEEALRALLRGEVDYLPTLPLKHVTSLQETPPWVVRKYAIPETHLLQFHPQSLLARSSELRRALLYAVDREQILTEEVLREAPREFGRLTTSPVPTMSESYSPLVEPFEPNLRVALSLALAAAKLQGGRLPTLKMVVPPDTELEPIVDRMIARWQRIGVEVVVVDPKAAQSERWDIAYRRVSLVEPLTQLWPFLTMNSTPRVADLQDLPGWLRQELIRLDLTTNWEDANTILFRLHEHLWSEVFYLPLWELDRYSIARRNLSGVPSGPLHPYQNLSLWIVDPWFDQTQP